MEDGSITKHFKRTPWLNLAGTDQYVWFPYEGN